MVLLSGSTKPYLTSITKSRLEKRFTQHWISYKPILANGWQRTILNALIRDVTTMHDEKNSEYINQNTKRDNPPGLVSMKLRLGKYLGDTIYWLFISIEELVAFSSSAGFTDCTIAVKQDGN